MTGKHEFFVTCFGLANKSDEVKSKVKSLFKTFVGQP